MLRKPDSLGSLFDEPEWVFPYAFMRIGDSFFIPTMRTAAMIYVAEGAARKEGFRVKAVPRMEDGMLGVRIWRIS